MTISTTAFGIYFYLMAIHHSSTTMLGAPEDHGDLAWLALASMAVFIAGKIIDCCHYCQEQSDSITSKICSCLQVLLSVGVQSHGW